VITLRLLPQMCVGSNNAKVIRALYLSSRALSSTPAEEQTPQPYFRTQQLCPLQHDQRHLGRIFTMEEESLNVHGVGIKDRFPNWLLRKEAIEHQQDLNEHAFLLRAPMLEATQYLKQIKAKRSNLPTTEAGTNSLKILFWGEDGCGKSTSLLYATDYCHKEGYIVLNFYKMSEAGSPLLEVVETGITRPLVAADALGVLFKELRLHCHDAVSQGNPDACKVALVVDGVGKLFDERTHIDRKMPLKPTKGPYSKEFIDESIAPDELSVVRSIKKMLKPDLPNTVVLATADIVDVICIRGLKYVDKLKVQMRPETQSYYPFALLGQEGWETMAPFVPIEVARYSKSEMDTVIDYHVERNYIQPMAATDPGRAEIHFLTGRHPEDFVSFSPEW